MMDSVAALVCPSVLLLDFKPHTQFSSLSGTSAAFNHVSFA
jgi:hypothetical protein